MRSGVGRLQQSEYLCEGGCLLGHQRQGPGRQDLAVGERVASQAAFFDHGGALLSQGLEGLRRTGELARQAVKPASVHAAQTAEQFGLALREVEISLARGDVELLLGLHVAVAHGGGQHAAQGQLEGCTEVVGHPAREGDQRVREIGHFVLQRENRAEATGLFGRRMRHTGRFAGGGGHVRLGEEVRGGGGGGG